MVSIGAAHFAAPAQAQIGRDQAAAQIAKDYGVEVLRVRPGEIGGKPVWLVTVMRPGGNFNAAFQVVTLAVEQATGDLVQNYSQVERGSLSSSGPPASRLDQNPGALRSRTWR